MLISALPEASQLNYTRDSQLDGIGGQFRFYSIQGALESSYWPLFYGVRTIFGPLQVRERNIRIALSLKIFKHRASFIEVMAEKVFL